ncbi:MAG: hypothetical protein AAB413_03950 [Patescibacteria group bacterium]
MRFKSSNQPHKGTTLVEILIFTAVGSILLLSVSSIYFSGLRSRTLVDAQQRVVYVDEFVLATLESWLTSSPSIQVPATGTTQQLIFSTLEGGSVTVERSGTDLVYSTSLLETGTLNSLGIRVTRFDVTRLSGNADTVRVEISYEVDTSIGRTIEYTNVYSFSSFYQ